MMMARTTIIVQVLTVFTPTPEKAKSQTARKLLYESSVNEVLIIIMAYIL